MAQVIVYKNPNGENVCVCTPSNELSIEEVLEKDCPKGAFIVDDSELPEDNGYFNAWELVDGKVIMNESKKQAIIDAEQSAISIKKSALDKLNTLGLTQDEIKALVG